MDCSSTLEQLDCVRPNSNDLQSSDFADARAHLAECEACRIEFAHRQRFDVAVSDVMQQVSIPNDQPAKLLQQFEVQDHLVGQPAVAKHSRRRILWRVVSLTACLAVMLAIVFWPRASRELSVGEVLARVSLDVPRLAKFDGNFAVTKPLEWNHISIQSTVLGQDLDGQPGDEVALRLFRFDGRRGHVVQGVLLTLPAKHVSPLPAADRFLEASPRYPSFGEQRFAAAAWCEGDRVYICLIPDQPGDLELLQQATQGSAA